MSMPVARPGSTSEARFCSLLDDCVHMQGRELKRMSVMPPCFLLSVSRPLLSKDSVPLFGSPRLPGPWLCVCGLQIPSRAWMCWVSSHWAAHLPIGLWWLRGNGRTFKSIGHVSAFITVDHGELGLEAPGFMGSANRKGLGGWAGSGSNDLTDWEKSIVS